MEREDDTRTNRRSLEGIYTLSNLRYSGHEDENCTRPLVSGDMGGNCSHKLWKMIDQKESLRKDRQINHVIIDPVCLLENF
jgi:hypothetical protein